MIPVGTHGLSCLGEEDYAAVALYMQDQALAIEAALVDISDDLASGFLRPSVVAVTTTVSGPQSSGSEQIYDLTATWTMSYENYTVDPSIISAGVRLTIPRTGWYAYGAYANIAATGAVTALSRRTLYARATREAVGVSTQLSQASFRTIDTNTGGEFLIASDASFYATIGTTVDVEAAWSHTNAASTVQVNTGAKLWCHFIGSGVEIGSA